MPQCQTHHDFRPPARPIKAPPLIQCRRTGRVLRAPGICRPPVPKHLAHAPSSQPSHLGPPLCSMQSCRLWTAVHLGANPNYRSAPYVPFPRGMAPQCWGLGPQSPAPDSHLGQATTCDHWGATAHSGLEKGQSTASPQRLSKAPCTETLGPKLRLTSALTSACSSARLTAFGSGLPASLWLTLTLGHPPRDRSQETCSCNFGDWRPPSPSARLSLLPCRHVGPSGHCCSFSAGEWARPSEGRHIQQPPAPKHLGPCSPCIAPSTWTTPLLTAQPSARA